MGDAGLFGLSAGSLAAILAMALASYLCRVLGVWLMAHVPLTTPVKRGLAALPGSIIVAIIAPLVVRGGPSALAALGAALISMLIRRNELLALAVGLTTVALLRAAGF
jgi:uncharacterized membrane protein